MFNNNNNIQQCILFKIHKVLTILYTLQIAIAIINKGVIKLHIKKKGKKKYKNTERKTPHTNSSTGVLLLEKKRLKLQLEVYTTYQVNFLKYPIK